jgi:hypothetical protein
MHDYHRRLTILSAIQILSQAADTGNVSLPNGFGRRHQTNLTLTLVLMLVEILASRHMKDLPVCRDLNHHAGRNADARLGQIGTHGSD